MIEPCFHGQALVVLSFVSGRRVDQSNGRRKRETAPFGLFEIFRGNLNNLGEIAIFTINLDFSWKWGFQGKMRLIGQ